VFSAEALVSVPMKSEIPLNYMIVEVHIFDTTHVTILCRMAYSVLSYVSHFYFVTLLDLVHYILLLFCFLVP